MRNLKKILSVLLVVAIMAISMVPAFAATSYTYEAQAKALYNVGLFKGVSATEYAPDLGSSVTREQGIALIVRLLGKADAAAALTATDADAALAAFTDAKDLDASLKNAVAYAVKNKLVLGATSTTIDPKGAMVGNALATILLRNLGYTVDDKAFDTATATLADKGGLTTAEATKFATKSLIRDDLVGIAYGSLKAKYSATSKTVIDQLIADKAVDQTKAVSAGIIDAPAAAATKVTAAVTGAKKFTLTFDGPVDATKVTASAITVKKGSSTYTVDSFKLAADKKSADITITNTIVAGDYTVSVTGIGTDAVSSKLTAENERIDKIEFPSEYASLKSLTDYTTIVVNFKILNQYGEDVTSKKASLPTYTITGELDSSDADDGILRSKKANDGTFIIGEKVTVSATYVDTDNSKTVFASAVLTVSQMAQVAELSISSLYNANNETLDIDSTYSDFKLIVDAKDQYGNSISYDQLGQALVVSSTDPSKLKFNTETLSGTEYAKFEQVTINGEKKTALSLADPSTKDDGKVTMILVSRFNGKIAQYEVTIKDSQKIDTLTLSTPDYPVAGEKVKIPFTAVDPDGNEITTLSNLQDGMNSNLKATNGCEVKFENDAATGKPALILDASSLTEKTTVYITGTTSTYKFVNYQVSLLDPAELESVSGFSSSAYANLLVGNTSTDYKFDNLLVKDTYGRDVTKDQLYNDYKLGTDYTFTLESSDSATILLSGTTGTVASSVYDVTTAVKPTLTVLKKGSSTLTLTLYENSNTDKTKTPTWKKVDDVTFSVNGVTKEDIKSYTATTVASVFSYATAYGSNKGFASAKNGTEIKVEGVLSSGKKVVIPRVNPLKTKDNKVDTTNGVIETNYYVTPSGDLAYDQLVNADGTSAASGKIYSKVALTDDTDDDVTASYTVTIKGNSKAETVTNSTKVSGVAPTAATMVLYGATDSYQTQASSTNIYIDYPSYAKKSDTVAEVVYSVANTEAAVKALTYNIVKFTDQYGVKMTNYYLQNGYTASATLSYDPYITNIIVTAYNGDGDIVDNATTYAADYSVYVTVVTADGKSFSYTLYLKAE
jgi:hypothetical protein